jgi:hypothetical protein
MKRFGLSLLAALTLVPLEAACRPVWGAPQECYDGFVEGEIVEIDLVEPYTPDGPYRWWRQGDWSPESCGGIDGLQSGVTMRVRVGPGVATDVNPCVTHRAEPIDTVRNVRFEGARGEGQPSVLGVSTSASGICGDSYWQLYIRRHPSLDDDPFGEPLVAGEYPPLRIRRWIDGCGCSDEWVGVIRHITPSDAGVDAR